MELFARSSQAESELSEEAMALGKKIYHEIVDKRNPETLAKLQALAAASEAGITPMELPAASMAPTSLPSAQEAFTPPPFGGGVHVDPLGNLTAKELRAHDRAVASIVHTQTIAEQELGINPRGH
jgi:hypothetical protein